MNPATLSGSRNSRSMTPAMRASRMLGWLSFGIAAAELFAPRRTARAVGLEGHEKLLMAYGAREALAGVGAHSVYPVPALWSRVAGDLVDLGTLAYAGRRPEGGMSRNTWIAIAAVAGIAVVDAVVASKLAGDTKEGKGDTHDYSSRSGFPGGVQSARGAGIVGDLIGGKAGGAAAGDVSPAGAAMSGRSSTDLSGAPASQGAPAPRGATDQQGAPSGRGSGDASVSAVASSGGQTMPKESQSVVPEPPAYTPT